MAKFMIVMSAILALAAGDVSHLFGQQHHQHYTAPVQVPQTIQRSYTQPQAARPYAILRLVNDNSGYGDYTFGYDTENGIQVNEQASLKNAGTNAEAKAAQGSYSYTGTDGVVYTVNWIADENGYRASGAHLPQPPPIPAEIQQSIDYIRSLPQTQQYQQK